MEKIIVTISKKAEIKIEVNGHKGPGCGDLTKSLEKALGKTTGDTNTDEYYEAEGTTQINVNQGN